MAEEPYHVTPCLVASLATIHPSNLASGLHSINGVLNPCRVGPLGGLRILLIEQHFHLFGLPLGARRIHGLLKSRILFVFQTQNIPIPIADPPCFLWFGSLPVWCDVRTQLPDILLIRLHGHVVRATGPSIPHPLLRQTLHMSWRTTAELD